MNTKVVFFCLFLTGFIIVSCSGGGSSKDQAIPNITGDDGSGGGGGGGDNGGGGSGGGGTGFNDSSGAKGSWDIPKKEVVPGCLGLDCIPSIDHPKWVKASDVDYVDDTDLIYGLFEQGKVWAFPENIGDWHEVINLHSGNKTYAFTYCPLTGSAVALDVGATLGGFDGDFETSSVTYGVSGLLFNNNLIPYDRTTGSMWSQMYLRSVNGMVRGTPMVTAPLVETTWDKWKVMQPNSLVLSNDTGFDRNYDVWPYGDYKEVEGLLFNISTQDHRLFFKERVLGIVTDRFAPSAKTYRFSLFDSPRAINDVAGGKPVLVAGMRDANFYISYSRIAEDGTELTFSIKADNPSAYPFDLVDNEGNVWNYLGVAISGARVGQRLTPTDWYNAFWFAWGTFFPGVDIYR